MPSDRPAQMPAERFSGGQAANRLGSELSRLSAEVESVREAVTEYAASGSSSMMARAVFASALSFVGTSRSAPRLTVSVSLSPVQAMSVKEQRDRLLAHLREIGELPLQASAGRCDAPALFRAAAACAVVKRSALPGRCSGSG